MHHFLIILPRFTTTCSLGAIFVCRICRMEKCYCAFHDLTLALTLAIVGAYTPQTLACATDQGLIYCFVVRLT